ncbi:C39 family peptidase [Cohnella algarum]|nr:C39 family peptidase [Cohnella algarum]
MEEAVAAAERMPQASIREEGKPGMLWNNYKPFTVYQGDKFLGDFEEYPEAVKLAKSFANSKVLFKDEDQPIWTFEGLPARTDMIDAPLIAQMPELPRGCEVTSLVMMLNYAGIDTDKMELAERVKKNPTPYEKKNGVIYFGNPYDGFVGDMYTFSKPGYGVYHGPIYELAEQYLPGRVIDMTGSQFEDILHAVKNGKPVWVISNTWFSQLPDSLFQTWETPTGQVKITYKEHSVLITGYDEKYIYFNDPLAEVKNRKIAVASFRAAWEQMGSQAITYV